MPQYVIQLAQVIDKGKPALLTWMFEILWNARASTNPAELDPSSNFFKFILGNQHEAKSQLFQDLLVLFVLKGKRNGYFIEFGATNGVTLSNTYLLEKVYGWSGILAEPARCWKDDLKKNRNCTIDYRCVWSETGKSIEFNETADANLSTTTEYLVRDLHASSRVGGKKYNVDTVSLNDLARSHNAPVEIDYLSLDTEGSELRILKNFDFQKHNIKLITVEHNFASPDREDIFALLISKGYVRIFQYFSAWDDWYVHRSVLR